MSRQLQVSGEDAMILSIHRKAQPVAEGIKVHCDNSAGYFAMVIQGETVPDEWASYAFTLSARRHDFGHGRDASMIWIFPAAAVTKINSKLPILASGIKTHKPVLGYVVGNSNNKPVRQASTPALKFA